MNFIICMTPLQVLIAEQIIRRQQPAQFIGLYLTDIDNAKHRHYANKLASYCKRSDYLVLPSDALKDKFKNFYLIRQAVDRLGLYRHKVEQVYLANIDLLLPLYAMSLVDYQQLMTFDDGTANIFPDSRYFNPSKPSFAKRQFKRLLGIHYPDLSALISDITAHYSIFPDETNIVDNVIAIDLFTQSALSAPAHPPKKIKKILLGQALDTFIGEEAYREMIASIVQRFGVTDFVPHPREQIDVSHLVTIDTDKIIEDYLLGELIQYPDTCYEIYTFFSTAVFSLKHFPRTQIFLLYNQALMARFGQAYQFLQDRGFMLIDVDKTNLEH